MYIIGSVIAILLLIVTVGYFVFFSRNEAENLTKQNTNQEKEEYIKGSLFINMPLMPTDRGYFFADPIIYYLDEKDIGEVTDEGTLLGDDGMPEACHVDMEIKKERVEEFKEFIKKNETNLGKGSYLTIGQEKLELGILEGLALILDNEVIESLIDNDDALGKLSEDLDTDLNGAGIYYSYAGDDKTTTLYYYGASYEDMKKILEVNQEKYPLLKKSKITRIEK